ncbi:MAG TPA: glucosyl-3-phosphoglycerate synthase [Mycobacteriales bacterium]|nr:glucosyl-3-phosphoglycerate synthase [Mycobacteriales bacterium]
MREDVRHWFEERTSRATDWQASRLVDVKGETRVSVVLPALNEQETVGAIVATIRSRLVERHGLIDELVVMDSGSTDGTYDAAVEAGAKVVRREEVLGDFEPLPGKGEVLWRSLAATTGDILVFVDSDLHDFTPDFVTGLLGPLLTNPSVQLVKATYDRHLTHGDTMVPAGGGRVTELVARPVINMHWPELAGFVQPLSGEYAARRTLLEQLPFPTGYGVEIGLLVDALRLVGLDGLAQVDLSRRKHRNQEIGKLGRMSSEILQVAFERLRREGRLDMSPVATELTQFERSEDDYVLVTLDMEPSERPPLRSVPEYMTRYLHAS